MRKEHWKPVPSLPGREISNLGRLRHGTRIYKSGCYGNNGRSATVKIDTVPNQVRIARLVGEAFCNDFRSDWLPVHRNGDKGDCRAINLKWVPRSVVTGIPYSKRPRTNAKGEAQPCSADFVMPFGKYRGQTLDEISDNDPGYVVWLADENVLQIETEFLDAVRRDDMEINTYGDEWAFRHE